MGACNLSLFALQLAPESPSQSRLEELTSRFWGRRTRFSGSLDPARGSVWMEIGAKSEPMGDVRPLGQANGICHLGPLGHLCARLPANRLAPASSALRLLHPLHPLSALS